MNGLIAAYYREFANYRKRWIRIALSSVLNPLLFLVTFGYGVMRFVGNETHSYLAFMVPGLISVSTMNQSYSLSFDIHIARRYFLTYEEFIVAPVRPWEIIAGEVLFGVTKSLPPLIFFLLFLLFNPVASLKINILFFIGWFINSILFSLIAFIVALTVSSHSDHVAISTFIINPMAFICDTFFPVERLGGFLEYIAYFLPLTHTTRVIRYAMWDMYSKNFFISLYFCLFFLLLLLLIAFRVATRSYK